MQKPTIHNIHNTYHADANFSVMHQYSKTLKQWKFVGFRCVYCENTFKTDNGIQKHHSVCKQINTIKKREVFMPIQVITVRGERMYRWGDQGKLYKDRIDAEKQARAAHAAGYKEKKDSNKK